MIDLPQTVRDHIHAHAREAMPRECCGLLLRDTSGDIRYWRCENIAPVNHQFAISPADYRAAEDAGEIVAIVHSHPAMPPLPSQADRVACRASGLPWLIVGYPSLAEYWVSPDEEIELPYVGREFAYGVLDCYTLVQDWYRRELGIILPSRTDYEDEFEWWLKGKDFYSRANAFTAGFIEVGPPFRKHDIHVMQIRSDRVANHVAIQLDDTRILHHLQGRLSEITVYGGFWQKVTLYTMRHRSLQSIA
jgi:proteasome lid subunit RPN8/RPN11